ncbi:hypothetical protein G6321_00009700 [Bradyrhizobium barranii subsp. barranii]|uniref:Uncharacterized protein n=1 Tax=Bradyrhizobium barranii subsp. barranii TaxID=2823807 RepID=A0A7Z0Q734_9BRAD|nr:hypothetical protein [Bradyrhizobium barranii]UGX95391.1 hypothetical protein G6321_00009700 [Bradyrhizobium barranii subsp. barranii]
MRGNDAIHLGLMLLAFAASYLVPFELLLLAYVVLGPARYFTEISWLHDRSYYLPHRGIAAVLAIVAVVAVLIDNASWFGLAMWGALVVCAMLAATTSAIESMLLFMVAIALSAIMYSSGSSLAVIGILIPTLIHVSLFTLIFMVLGAHRSGSRVQAALVVVYLLAVAMILLLPPTAEIRISSFARVGQDYFGNVGPALGRLFGVPGLVLDTRLTSLLAFVYTYHYLNWFIKADVIRWTEVPKARLAAMAAASAASTALYFYDYAFGFTFLLALSLIHILLEFPLDNLALRQLGAAMQGAVRARYAGPIAASATRSRSTGTKAAKRATWSR